MADDVLLHLDLCGRCEAPVAATFQRIGGITGITLDADPSGLTPRGPVKVYAGPVPGPCPNEPEESDRG
ncbi:hypothetical protein ACFT54_10160 [Streptomyces cinereoruber]|uniref:hypothetical protein n=1 Tax=Streptomyces cinereoruber TaxID=67260 RepID=UPI00363723AC